MAEPAREQIVELCARYGAQLFVLFGSRAFTEYSEHIRRYLD